MTPWLTLARGALSIPLLISVSEAFSAPFYTLIKLYYTKALIDQASSLATNRILHLQRPRILMSSVVQQQPFKRSGSTWTLVSGNCAGT